MHILKQRMQKVKPCKRCAVFYKVHTLRFSRVCHTSRRSHVLFLACLWVGSHMPRHTGPPPPPPAPAPAPAQPPPPRASPVPVDYVRVEVGDGFSLPRLTLRDRRSGGSPMLRWCFQRHIEAILYKRSEGGSSGAIWKLLNQTGLGRTALSVNAAAVAMTSTLSHSEFDEIMRLFRQNLPDVADPSSVGRIRSCTLLPVATVAAIARTFGHSNESTALLRALAQAVPEGWQLAEQQALLAERNEVDLLIEEQLEQDQGFEAEEKSFAEELTEMAKFTSNADDEGRMQQYSLQRPPPLLTKELDSYISHRTATFAARRAGGAVVSMSAENDKQCLLRFYGYLHHTHTLPEDAALDLSLMARGDLGDLAQAYAVWLQNNQHLKFSSIANYLNGMVSIVSYVYSTFEVHSDVLNLDPSPLAQLLNLRGQAEKASRTQSMYEQRVGGWMTWEDVQQSRVKAMHLLNTCGGGLAARRPLLRDATAVSLLSLIPPDRVGLIRKLRLGHTLKRREAFTTF